MTYQQLEEMLAKWNGKVCIFGAGLIGKTWGYDVLTSAGGRIDFYCDNHITAGKMVKNQIETIDFSYLCKNAEHVLVCVAVKESNQNIIRQQLEDNGIQNYILMNRLFLQEICESVLDLGDDVVVDRYKTVVDDAEFLKKQFSYRMGYEPDLKNPKTFNEKMQWLKLYDRKPEYTRLVDKYEFKKYIQDVLGNGYTISVLGVWNHVDDINWDELPQQFVIKCTHDSGSVFICRDKTSFDKNEVCRRLSDSLERNYYWLWREWPYKNVKPRIIAEEYLQDCDRENLMVYKVLNFGGEPKVIQVIQNDKTPGETVDYYDTEWKRLGIRQNFKNSLEVLPCPLQLKEMLDLARGLSKDFSVIRTDFYVVNGKVYVSEFTFYSDAGMEPFHPQKWDKIWGDWVDLPYSE